MKEFEKFSYTPTVYMMVGLPYSGKITYVKDNSFLKNLFRLSSDDIVHDMASADGTSYNKDFKKYYKKAKNEMKKEMDRLMSDRSSFILDRTNLTKKSRAFFLRIFKNKGYKVVAISFNHLMSYDDIQDRVKSRPDQIISEKIYNKMMETFEKPTNSEGFDEIVEL